MKNKSLRKGIILSLVLVIWLRLVLFVIGYNFATKINPFPITTREMDYSEDIPQDRTDPWFYFVQPLHRFDALWYEEVAKNGYQVSQNSAFFPLFPWTNQLIANIFSISYPSAAFAYTTVLTFLVFFLLYYFTSLEYGEKLASKTVLIYSIFPTSFILLTPYAESLLFTLILLALIFMRRGWIVASIITGCLATLTKVYGFVIIIPLALMIYKNKEIKRKFLYYGLLLLIPLSLLGILEFQKYMGGPQATPLNVQPAKFGMWLVSPWDPVFKMINDFRIAPLNIPNNLTIIVVVGSIILLIKTWEKIRNEYWFFVASFFLVFYFTFRMGSPAGIIRYVLILFPLFMAMGNLKVDRTIQFIYICSSFALFIILFIYYTFGFFVA